MRLLALLTLLSTAAQAHDGHGLSGSHWHVTDIAMWMALGLAIGLGLWWTRK